MEKKYLIIGIVIGLVAILLYLNFGVQCYDGQGFTLYIPKDTLMNNLADANDSQIKGRIPPTIFTSTATLRTSCGKIKTRIIVESDEETKVSQKVFDKFVADYNVKCENCLFKVYQSGNSPLFLEEISSNKLFIAENINGTLSLKEIIQ